MQHTVKQLRWLRDCVKELHDGGNPALAELVLDVATVLALTPPLASALGRWRRDASGRSNADREEAPCPQPNRSPEQEHDMNAIRSVFTALANLASSLNALAGVLDVAAGRLRQQLALDGETAPVLERNGEVLEHAAAEGNGGAAGRRRKGA